MKTKFIKSILPGSLMALAALNCAGQCTIPSPPATSAPCGAQNFKSGLGWISGGTYYSTSTQTVTGTNLNGGGLVLYVCSGTLTMVADAIDGGTIVVEAGATLDIDNPSGSQLLNNIVNYGTVTVSGATTLAVDDPIWNYGTFKQNGSMTMNSGSAFYNASTSSSLTIVGQWTSGTNVVNLGSISISTEWDVDGGNACLGPNSTITAQTFENQTNAGYITVSPAGSFAGLTITNQFSGDGNSITSSTGLDLCLGTAATSTYVADGGNPGNAIVQTNCSAVTLPVILSSFTAQTAYNNVCTVSWTTSVENGISGFVLESSQNGSDFNDIATVTPNGYPSTYNYTTTLTAQTWFRLKMESPDGEFSYSSVILGDYLDNKSGSGGQYSLRIQPNLVTDGALQIYCTMASGQVGNWVVVDMTGRTVFQQNAQLSAGETNVSLTLPGLSSGMYRLLFQTNNIRVVPVPFSIIH